MKYLELIELLAAEPSDTNIDRAKDWLSKKTKATKSTVEVALALVLARHDTETLNWLGSWMEEKNWDALLRIAESNNLDLHDWLVQFAQHHPAHPQVCELWKTLLGRYDSEKLVDVAGEWLTTHSHGRGGLILAYRLIQSTDDNAVRAKAMRLAREFLDEPLVTMLIKLVGDESSIALGAKIMKSIDPTAGMFIAAALLKNNPVTNWPIVEGWLRKHWDDQHADWLFHWLVTEAPLTVSPLAFAWIDEHPQFDRPARIFSSALVLSPSQQLIDLIWNWLRTQLNHRHFPELLSLVFMHWGELKTPREAVAAADGWLKDNTRHKLWPGLLLDVLRLSDEISEARITLAKLWLDNHDDSEAGFMLMNLNRVASEEFSEKARAWAQRHPYDERACIIIEEQLTKNGTE